VPALREANARILTGQGNYWSAEGMAALLSTWILDDREGPQGAVLRLRLSGRRGEVIRTHELPRRDLQAIFQRSLTAHLPGPRSPAFRRRRS
jgi:hypothetical protein